MAAATLSGVVSWQGRAGEHRCGVLGMGEALHQGEAADMMISRPFDVDRSAWGEDREQKLAWLAALNRTGPSGLRIRLAQHDGSSNSTLAHAGVFMTRGFAEEWLDWRDQQDARKAAFFQWSTLLISIAAAAGSLAVLVK